VIGLAAGVALALLGLRLRHRLDVSAEILPSHHLLDRLQRIALGADRLQPTLNIEKPLLPMTRSLHPPISACAHRVRFVGTWREEFFEAPLNCWHGVTFPEPLLPTMRSFFQCLIWTFSSSIVRISMKYFRQISPNLRADAAAH